MRNLFALSTLALLAMAPAARAAQRPLLVVVETGVGANCDAAAVRKAVGAELHAPVAAPGDKAASESRDTLIVAIDGGRIAMSLRARPDQLVDRAIPAPPDRAGRLRAIAWLAGNLARDQTTEIVAQPLPAFDAPPVAPAPRPALASPRARPITEPPPLRQTDAATREVVSASAPLPVSSEAPRWSVTIAGGPTATPDRYAFDSGMPLALYDTGWQVEVQRRAADDSFWGAAAEAAADRHPIGALAFLGVTRRKGRWRLEASAGTGLEIIRGRGTTSSLTSSPITGTASNTTVSTGNSGSLYARAMVGLGLPMGRSVELWLRLGAHLAPGGLDDDFLTGSIGLRVMLP